MRSILRLSSIVRTVSKQAVRGLNNDSNKAHGNEEYAGDENGTDRNLYVDGGGDACGRISIRAGEETGAQRVLRKNPPSHDLVGGCLDNRQPHHWNTLERTMGTSPPPLIRRRFDCFYEKVIKVKADVAALLSGSLWLSPHFHRNFCVRIAQERRLATRSTHSISRFVCLPVQPC